eukprot:354427-Chlamydomonas_euryale.AAC.2
MGASCKAVCKEGRARRLRQSARRCGCLESLRDTPRSTFSLVVAQTASSCPDGQLKADPVAGWLDNLGLRRPGVGQARLGGLSC